MSNLKKYQKVFIDSFLIDEKKIKLNTLKYQDIQEWDSIGHMTLISNLEDQFKINVDTDDIVDFSSFKKGIKILEKYKVKF